MITDSYDILTDPVMTEEDFYGPRRRILDTCLITFSEQIRDAVLAAFPCEEIAAIHACNGTTPIYAFSYQGKRIAFYLSPVGAASAGTYVIEANWLTGATRFIMFGSCGSLDGEKTRGRFIVPTECYRDEGMSYHYAPPADYITVPHAGRVAAILGELGLPFIQGRVWTTDAFMRETAGLIARRKQEGCIAVEMEAAGVQAVCSFHGFHLYVFLAAGDVLSETEAYQVQGLADANHNTDKFRIGLEIALRLPGTGSPV